MGATGPCFGPIILININQTRTNLTSALCLNCDHSYSVNIEYFFHWQNI